MQADGNLTGSLIYAARLCRTLRADLLLQLGIYSGQDTLLKTLARQDGQSMSELAAALGVRPPTVSKMVARLEAQGFVRRQGSPRDSRRAHVHLTEAGTGLLERIDQAWARAEAVAFGRLSDKELKRLRKILRKVRIGLAGGRGGDSVPASGP
ncbi:MAG: MarR family transcriptional regulator [Alphaproteobacteria bacterium]|nr:MAG: MarR family transcriptional regulator [Alphaproteobacteria bacterium]